MATTPAAGSAQQHHDLTRPSIMAQAAAQASLSPARRPGPFQPAPPLSPHASSRPAIGQGAALTAGPFREVFGFVNAGNLADPQVGYASWNFSLLSTVAFFGLHVNSGDGSLVTTDTGWTEWNSSDLTNLLTTAHRNGVRVVVSIILQDFSPSNATMCAGLQHASTTLSQIASQVSAKGADGVNVDYEGENAPCGTTTTQALLTGFVGQLRSALPAGSYLSVDTYAGSAGDSASFFDVRGLAPSVDSFFVMAYDLDVSNWSSVPPGCASYCMNPVAPLTTYRFNDTTTASQYAGAVPANKVILGVPYYGRTACVAPPDAPRPGPNAAASSSTSSPRYLDSVSTPTTPGVTAYIAGRDTNDATGQEPFATWLSDAAHFNCWRESYWDDTVSLGQKYSLINQTGLRGVGIFTLDYGGGSPELWSALGQAFAEPGNFEPLGGNVTAAPAAASWAANRLDVFARGADGSLWHRAGVSGSWAPWEPLGGHLAGPPAVVSWGASRLDVFARGLDGALWHRAWNSSAWSGWESLGGQLTGAPVAVSWATSRLDAFVRGADGSLWHQAWNGSGWTGWEGLGGQFGGAPGVASWAPNRLDAFVQGTDGSLWHQAWNGSGWTGWEGLGGRLTSPPTVVAWGPNRLDSFGRGTDATVWHQWWSGTSWGSWEPLGGSLIAGPAAASTGVSLLDAYGLGQDTGLWHRQWNGSAWSGWTAVGGHWMSDASALVVQMGSGHVDAFLVGPDGGLWHTSV